MDNFDDFDTQINPEETQEYQNYLDANEEKAKPKEVWPDQEEVDVNKDPEC